jgi:hypothetical protein
VGRGGDLLHRPLVGVEESRLLDEIADAVAGQRHLGCDDDVGALAAGLVDRAEDRGGVPVDVPARGVELSERDAHCRYRSVDLVTERVLQSAGFAVTLTRRPSAP